MHELHVECHAPERLRRHDLYDRFLAREFVPWVRAHSHHPEVMVYGASMGGFHALNFAARHPDLVTRAIALSGFFDITRLLQDQHWDDLSYYHSPVHYVSNMDADWVGRLSRVQWVVATGEHDSLVEETRRMAGVFRSKGIPVHEEIWPDVFGHDWPFRQQHLPRLSRQG